MAKNKKLIKNKGIVAFIIALGVLAVFAYLISYNGGIVVRKTESTKILSKLSLIKLKGGEFQLDQRDVDELSNLYAKPMNKGAMTLKGVNIEVLDEELLIQAPISLNNLNLLFTSRGKINISNGEIVYIPENFKIGKLTLPKSLVISQIKKQNNEIFYVEDNLIKIKESVLPFKISTIKIEDNKIVGTAGKLDIKKLLDDLNNSGMEVIDKQLVSLEQKIQNALVLMNEEQKEKAKKVQNTIEEVKGKSIVEKRKVISDIISMLERYGLN